MATAKPVVLVVDDDTDILAAAAHYLEPVTREVLTCTSGEAAMGHVQSRNDIDLVLTDVRMPGMSGIELAAEIRKLRPGVPVVLTSVYLDAPTGLPFVPKPWRAEALRAVLRYHLGQ
jgi:CheY-like chemotaxis protein